MARNRAMSPGGATQLAREYFPSFLEQREHVNKIQKWYRPRMGEDLEEGPFIPKDADISPEYHDLAERSTTPWMWLVVKSLAQTMYVDGVRRPSSEENMEVWRIWRRNRWNARQIQLHRAVLAHGFAFATVLPGTEPLTGLRTSLARPVSAARMAAFYADDTADDFPLFAIKGTPIEDGHHVAQAWNVELWDEWAVHYLRCEGEGATAQDWTYLDHLVHGSGLTPVVRHAPDVDLADGKAWGEVEPFIPMAKRIDQDVFDRLIVQRFGAWKIRWVTGMAIPSDPAAKKQLLAGGFMGSTSAETKFGTLEETDLNGFIAAKDADLRDLSAVSQTPPHHLLGLSSNLQAEALAAAEAGLQRKSADYRTGMGESYEQQLQLMAMVAGLRDEAAEHDMQIRWRDTESRSFAQAAQALGIVAQQLRVPVEMLWERIPGWTDGDTERAQELIRNGSLDQFIEELTRGASSPAGIPGAQEPAGEIGRG